MIIKNQEKTNYHKIVNMFKSIEDFGDDSIRIFNSTDVNLILELCKKSYKELTDLNKKLDKLEENTYGIRYFIYDDDGSGLTKFETFFYNKERRDTVYADWENNYTWDETMKDYLEYPAPSNLNKMVKIFKFNNKIYEE